MVEDDADDAKPLLVLQKSVAVDAPVADAVAALAIFVCAGFIIWISMSLAYLNLLKREGFVFSRSELNG